MITLTRLELVRQDSQPTAAEFKSLETQLNALPFVSVTPHFHVKAGPAPMLDASTPAGYLEIQIRGQRYVLPFFAKG